MHRHAAKETVRRFYRASTVDDLLAKPRAGRASVLDEFKPYLHDRWNAGGSPTSRTTHGNRQLRRLASIDRRDQPRSLSTAGAHRPQWPSSLGSHCRYRNLPFSQSSTH
jgi:hypothetical protein